MKHSFFFIILFYAVSGYSQTLKLDLSLPQPRLGQKFYVTFNSDTLSKQIFNLPPDKFKINSYQDFTGVQTSFSVSLEALKIGQNVIGPFIFKFNGKTYKTDVIKFNVADSLPNVDEGTWIRKVPVDDTTIYIMIDQRIPAHNQVTRKDSNTISMSAKVDEGKKEVQLTTGDLENAKIENWGSSSETKSDILGEALSYGSYYKCYKVTIIDKSKPLVLTKNAFENLPDYYKFQNIQIN
jgi:hypothetical protein